MPKRKTALGLFRPDQIERRQREDTCTRCSIRGKAISMFYWTSCKHCYCVNCAIDVINESLSIMNEIPKCIHSECNLSLNIFDAHSIPIESKGTLLPKYQMSRLQIHSVFSYNSAEALVSGYIRLEFPCKLVPVDVVLMIFDFYELQFWTKSPCHLCKSSGFEHSDCTQCGGRGFHIDCKACNAKGFRKKKMECRGCHGWGDFNQSYPCRKCLGSGLLHPLSSLHPQWGYEFDQCPRECHQCGGRGIYHHHTTCNKCKGNGFLFQKEQCHKCNGTKTCIEYKTPCTLCNGKKVVSELCRICEGNKVTMALDFNKICHKQSLCILCGLYYPNDSIVYWSGCNHVLCIECMTRESLRQSDLIKRVPLCPFRSCSTGNESDKMDKIYKSCSSPLTLDRMNSIPGIEPHGYCSNCKHYKSIHSLTMWSSSCGHTLCTECCVHHIQSELHKQEIPICPQSGCTEELTVERMSIISRSSWKYQCIFFEPMIRTLEQLHYRKDKFQCLYCSQWHPNHEKVTDDVDTRITWKAECALSYTFCEGCYQYVHCSRFMSWSTCDHLICIQCAFGTSVSMIQRGNIPLCLHSNCGCKLQLFTVNNPCSPLHELKDDLKALYDRMDLFFIRLEYPDIDDKYKCLRCGEWHNIWDVVIWSESCGHEFCRKCIKQMIDEAISTEIEVMPSMGIQFGKCKRPRCEAVDGIRRCPFPLSLTDSELEEIGASKYQIQVLQCQQITYNADIKAKCCE